MAAGDLTTLADVKAFIPGYGASAAGVTGDDALFASLIASASAFLKSWLNRSVGTATFTQTYSGMGGCALLVDEFPITAIASVTVDGVSVPAGSVTAPGFYFDSDAIYLNGYAFTRGLANVAVVYTAGYATVPLDIASACVSLVARTYKERTRIGLTSEAAGQQTTAFATWALSPREELILMQYRSVVRAA